MAYRLKHVLEYAALRGVIAFVQALPLRGALAVGWVLAGLSYPFVAKRAREARRRMRQVFGPGTPDASLRKWSWISWRNVFFNIIEAARISRLSRSYIVTHVNHRELDKLKDLHRQSGGFVLAVCHMGNWDLAGFTCRVLDIPIFVLIRQQSNPLVNRYLEKMRDRFSFGVIERHQALGSIVKRIRAGEIFTILPDIRAKSPDSAVMVPFLGHPAHLMGGTALFARLTGKPVVTAIVTRVGWSHHHFDVEEPLYPDASMDRDEDIRRLTTLVMARFDQAIRKQPEQYFWYNKRWVLDDRF